MGSVFGNNKRWFLAGGLFCAVVAWGIFASLLAGSAIAAEMHPEIRIKDLVDVEGVRSNQLVGMGLVVGLPGTGDKGALVTQMMQNMAQQFGLAVDAKGIKSKNAAVVTVTCNLPPFVRSGQTVDVSVSTIGDAKSLQGGMLLQTPLKAADGNVYAVAQGPLLVGGFEVAQQGAAVAKNVTTSGRIPGGAIVERDVPMEFVQRGAMTLLLRNPDFTTAQRVADALNGEFGRIARPLDASRVEVALPMRFETNPAAFLAQAEMLRVTPDMPARVVVNERSGTVVLGGEVKISAVAVAHGNLTVQIRQTTDVSQPQPFSQGETVASPNTDINVDEQQGRLLTLPASTNVQNLVDSLNDVGATPRDVITILQAIKDAGALHGELVIQ